MALHKDLTASLRSQKLSWGEVQIQAKKVLELNRQMLESGKLTTSQALALKANMKDVGKVYGEASKGARDFGVNVKVNADAMKEFGRHLEDAVRSTNNLASSMGKVAQSHLERHVMQYNQALRAAGHSSKILNFLEDMFAKAHAVRELKRARETHTVESSALHRKRMKEVMTGAQPQTFEDYKDIVKTMAYGKGAGWLGRSDVAVRAYAARAQNRAEAGGAPPGFFENLAIRGSAKAGEGGLAGVGAAEGGIGAGLGVAAIGYSIFKVIEKFIDTRAQINQGIEKGLGAGLFVPGETGTTALYNVRQNLRASFFSAYGQNLDRNLAIAQAMQEQGIDITELARGNIRGAAMPGGETADTGAGFLGGVFGEFQRNAMVAGRGAGLTDQETVVRMTKMIHEMRQTFEATSDFLFNVNTQARAAGISTVKYLSVIDDLTSLFDKMNKSFAESVSLVQSLGMAGTATADDISDMAKALTGAGENKTIEQNAAGFSFMSKDQRTTLVASVQKSVNEADAALQQAMAAGKPGGVRTNLDLNTPEGLMMLQTELAGMPEGEAKKNILKAAERKRFALNQLQGIAIPAAEGDYARAAIGIQEFGQGAEVQTANQTALMTQLLPGGNFLSLLNHQTQAIESAVLGGGTLGYQATDYQDVLKAIVSLGSALAPERVAQTKALPQGERTAQLKKFFDYGKLAHVFPGGDYDEKQMLSTLNDNVAMSKIIAEEIAANPDEFQDALHEEQLKGRKEDQKKQLQSVALQTRTTADIYANAFEYLFTMLEKPISAILNWLEKTPSTASPEAKTAWRSLSRNVDIAEAALEDKAAGGDKVAQDTLSTIQAMETKMRTDPDAVTAAELDDALKKVHDNSDAVVTDSSNQMMTVLKALSPTQAPEDLGTNATDDAMEAQALRNAAAVAGPGQFDFTGDQAKYYLGKNLDDAAMAAYNRTHPGEAIQPADNTGKQYISIVTLNSTEAQMLLNYGIATGVKSGENTLGGGGVTGQSSSSWAQQAKDAATIGIP